MNRITGWVNGSLILAKSIVVEMRANLLGKSVKSSNYPFIDSSAGSRSKTVKCCKREKQTFKEKHAAIKHASCYLHKTHNRSDGK